MIRCLVIATLACAACQQEPISVKQGTGVNDYNHAALQAAVQKFVAANRTPPAYAELWHTVLTLRPGMDRATAEEAELSIVTLALAPMNAAADRPMPEQVATMALAVWPALFAKEIEADEILRKRDGKVDDVLPKNDETPTGYLQRICGAQLAAECKQIVPESQGHVIAALATRRGAERVHNAIADCMLCGAEPGWQAAATGWEELDHQANTWIHDVEVRADPGNWPIAGAASMADPGLPEAEIAATGEVILGGQRSGALTRIEALRDLRFMHGEDSPIALQLRPDLTLAQVKGILTDVRKSGAKKIAVIARGTFYPWERRIYWLSDSGGVHAGLRTTDTLQLLLHAVDHLGEPGSVARVD